MGELLKELQRRQVIRVAAAYLVTTWLILQVASILTPALLLPSWTLTLITVLLIIGFFPAVLFAWAYELTPADEGTPGDDTRRQTRLQLGGNTLNILIFGALVLIAGLMIFDRTLPQADEPGARTAETDPHPGLAMDIKDRPRTSIAVLPFANFGAADQEYFSDGISEELLNLLAKTEGLRVAARTSSFNFKETQKDVPSIGRLLNVETVLEGSVRWAGDDLRITAQLIDVESGYHLWSETYNRKLTHVFQVQDDIAREIVSSLHIQLSGGAPEVAQSKPTDIEAYKAYLEGVQFFRLRGFDNVKVAQGHFDRALAIDPDYVPALAARANATSIFVQDWMQEEDRQNNLRLARSFLDRAKTLDQENSDVLTALGFYEERIGDHAASLEFFELALARDPNNVQALQWKISALYRLGRFEEADGLRPLLLSLDPLSPINLHNEIMGALTEGDFDTMERHLETMAQVEPRPDRLYYNIAGYYALARGTWADLWALTQSPQAKASSPADEWGTLVCQTLLADCRALFEWTPARDALYQYFNAPANAPIPIGKAVSFTSEEFARIYDAQLHVYRGQHEAAIAILTDLFRRGDVWVDEVSQVPDQSGMIGLRLLWAFRQTGQQDAFEDLAREIRENDYGLKVFADGFFSEIGWAEYHTITGDPDKGLAHLKAAQNGRIIPWHFLRAPWFDDLSDRPEFQSIWEENFRLVNLERAKLGLQPAERFDRRPFTDDVEAK